MLDHIRFSMVRVLTMRSVPVVFFADAPESIIIVLFFKKSSWKLCFPCYYQIFIHDSQRLDRVLATAQKGEDEDFPCISLDSMKGVSIITLNFPEPRYSFTLILWFPFFSFLFCCLCFLFSASVNYEAFSILFWRISIL